MANPPTAKPFDEALDPEDVVDFYIYLNQGAPDAQVPALLLLGEGVASYALQLSPEAVAIGLIIRNDGAYQPALIGNELAVYLTVDPAHQADSIFDDFGVTVAIRVKIVSTATPPRTKRRSVLVRIANQ